MSSMSMLFTGCALDLKRKRHQRGAYYMEDLDEVSCMAIGLSRFIGSSEWKLSCTRREYETVV